jgi:hypothetical protein
MGGNFSLADIRVSALFLQSMYLNNSLASSMMASGENGIKSDG